jgi:hypothetical protein
MLVRSTTILGTLFFIYRSNEFRLVLPNILTTLHQLYPYNEVYYGREVVLEAPFNFGYHTGMAYFLSADLVRWIATSSIPAEMFRGHEDHLVAEWFIKAGWKDSLSRWVSDGEFVDCPRNRGTWAARYTPHTRAIHQLKRLHDFVEAARWFMDKDSRDAISSRLRMDDWDFPDERVIIPFSKRMLIDLGPKMAPSPERDLESWTNRANYVGAVVTEKEQGSSENKSKDISTISISRLKFVGLPSVLLWCLAVFLLLLLLRRSQ